VSVVESKDIKVHLVCEEDLDDWILGKFARRLRDALLVRDIQCDISNKPNRTADVNHYINFLTYCGRQNTIATVMITHIDTENKLILLQRQLAEAEMGICMSGETVENLAAHGIPRSKLCYIHPGHDGVVRPRRTIIGITSRIYSDTRKREGMLLDLAGSISPEDFAFEIMGAGWDVVVAQLRLRGFEVNYFAQFESARYGALIAAIDYYLYFGLDEGSMGFLDALSAGVATIVPAHGFHLDAPGGITHPFINAVELKRIFDAIAAEKRKRRLAVASWTWPAYAETHLAVWEYLLARRTGRAVRESVRSALREIGFVCNEPKPDQATVDSAAPALASALKNRDVLSRPEKPAYPMHLRLRVGAEEDIEFMRYLIRIGDKREALRIAARALRARPFDLSVWRRVISTVVKSNRLLRQVHRLYKGC
jgi:hypothetical protein